jgi:hypothetical protein
MLEHTTTRARSFLTSVSERYTNVSYSGRVWIHLYGVYYIFLAVAMVVSLQYLMDTVGRVVTTFMMVIYSSWLLVEYYVFECRSLLFGTQLMAILFKLWTAYYYFVGCQRPAGGIDGNGAEGGTLSGLFWSFCTSPNTGVGRTAYFYTEFVLAIVLFVITIVTYLRAVLIRPLLVKFLFILCLLIVFLLCTFSRLVGEGSGYLCQSFSVVALVVCGQLQIVHASKFRCETPSSSYEQVFSFVYVIRTLWPMAFVNVAIIGWYFCGSILVTYISCGQMEAQQTMRADIHQIFQQPSPQPRKFRPLIQSTTLPITVPPPPPPSPELLTVPKRQPRRKKNKSLSLSVSPSSSSTSRHGSRQQQPSADDTSQTPDSQLTIETY